MAFPERSLQELAALTGVVLGREDLSEALAEICRITVAAVPGAEGSSLAWVSDVGLNAVATSGDWAAERDETQYEEREGPCLDAARSGLTFRIRDTADEPRWPSYMPRAAALGAGSMVSLPLVLEGKATGALNVYARVIDAFGAEEVAVAEVIAGHASLASQVAATLFHQKALAEELRTAMASRIEIEQAKGVIMATTRCGPEAAFRLLVTQSQHENRKLRDIAAELVARYAAFDPPS